MIETSHLKLHKFHNHSILLILSGGLQYQKNFINQQKQQSQYLHHQ